MMLLNFYSVAAQHSDWVATRRQAIAENIANADVAGYKAKDVADFASFISAGDTVQTQNSQLDQTATNQQASVVDTPRPVELDGEMVKAAEVARDQSLNMGLSKAFNRLFAMTVRG